MDLPDICDYCNRSEVVLYAWHADPWCADCIAELGRGLPLEGDLKDAPRGRPAHPTYERPFVWQTPDGSVLRGEVQP